MESMVFQVSAKTATIDISIINLSNGNIEFVKNGYDADAECVYVKYINPFNGVPSTLTRSEVHSYFNGNMEIVLRNYSIKDGLYVLN